MSFELFTKKGRHSTVSPGAYMTKSHLYLNALLMEQIITNFAELLWDKETQQIALKPCETPTYNSYKISGNDHGRTIHVLRFVEEMGIKVPQRFSAKRNGALIELTKEQAAP